MTKTEFILVCLEYLIDPSVALENADIVEAINTGSTEKLRYILENEF